MKELETLTNEFSPILESLNKVTRREIKIFHHKSNRASALGHPCVRNLTYWRIPKYVALVPPYSPELQVIFNEGNLHEKAVFQRLEEAGITILEQQRPFYWDKYDIAGSIDAKILFNGKVYPAEVKSISPYKWTKLRLIKS
jgi:hypothetical protein